MSYQGYQTYDQPPPYQQQQSPQTTTIISTEFESHRGPCSWLLNILWILFGGGLVLFLIWG